jgi:trk system potassium uptake protein TrkH
LNFRLIARHLGQFVIVLATVMVVCALLSLLWAYRGEADESWAFESLALCGLAGGLLGGIVLFTTRAVERQLGRRDAVLLVTMTWVVGALYAALPYWIWSIIGDPDVLEPSLRSFTSCCFEGMSGLTTTGATIIDDIEAMPKGLLVWRAMTQWVGGLGIVVLFVALGVGGKRLFMAESTGPSPVGLRPHIRETARILWLTYLVLTVAAFVAYAVLGMPLYEAGCQALTTISTAGFSTRSGSFASFQSAAIEWVAILFMFLSGISFALYFRAIRRGWRALLHDTELRVYIGLLILAVAICSAALIGRGTPIQMVDSDNFAPLEATFWNSFRSAAFTVVSLQSTTGYCTADFDYWPRIAISVLLILGFVGGCAGSTAGGVKVIRSLISVRILRNTIEREHRPSVVRPLKIGRSLVESSVKIEVLSVLVAAMLSIFLGAALLMMIEGVSIDLKTALGASWATALNIGPGFGHVGAIETYSVISPAGKWVLMSLMLMGRLEFFTVLVLLTRRFWVTD